MTVNAKEVSQSSRSFAFVFAHHQWKTRKRRGSYVQPFSNKTANAKNRRQAGTVALSGGLCTSPEEDKKGKRLCFEPVFSAPLFLLLKTRHRGEQKQEGQRRGGTHCTARCRRSASHGSQPAPTGGRHSTRTARAIPTAAALRRDRRARPAAPVDSPGQSARIFDDDNHGNHDNHSNGTLSAARTKQSRGMCSFHQSIMW